MLSRKKQTCGESKSQNFKKIWFDLLPCLQNVLENVYMRIKAGNYNQPLIHNFESIVHELNYKIELKFHVMENHPFRPW